MSEFNPELVMQYITPDYAVREAMTYALARQVRHFPKGNESFGEYFCLPL